MHNLAYILGLTAILPEDLNTALKYLARARRRTRSRRKSIPRLKLRWLEGIILAKFGSWTLAESILKQARRGFIKAKAIYEAACTSLDLSALYRDQQRWEELEVLAAESCALLQGQTADAEVLAALALWSEAVGARTFDTAVVEQVRIQLQAKRIG